MHPTGRFSVLLVWGGPRMRVLDLFCGLKGWSAPFAARGHEIVTLDFDASFAPDIYADILEVAPADLGGPYDVVLASPPCEAFSVMNIGKNWNHDHTPKTQRAWLGMSILSKTVELIDALQPAFFVIENPVGKMRRMPVLAPFEIRTITQCQYGESRMKPTDLWGGFPPSLELRPQCAKGAPCHVAAPRGSRTPGSVQGTKSSAERAKIPEALALAVMEACERDLAEGAVAVANEPRLFA